ncbi:FixH family protein [Pedobacter metabolipauper]|uniref:FixH protein n=1 Tax=Pedobacter metabolipauper TaxID=425513 RepID=A0A4R6SY37_9SPHI|nr:FixH family protein [Pedobacter metabolipauper]TDQ11316.1 hypothetical protein ATK78_0434 [Pedobacter metabolipauper]
MNWGTKLVIGMATFMTFIIVLAVCMFRSKTDALVDTDYYEKGLNYNADYKLKEQVKADHAAPAIYVGDDGLWITFQKPATGKIRMVRNSDKRMDQSISMGTDSLNRVNIPLPGVAKGQWKLIINWLSDEKNYLYEQEVMIR